MARSSLYLVTGACGHLGGTLIRYLRREGCAVRGLMLPEEEARDGGGVAYYRGNVADWRSLAPFFSGLEPYDVTVLHTAGIVSIGAAPPAAMYDVNVNGTRNVLDWCRRSGVRRLVYVSSVHALEEGDGLGVIREADRFSPERVTGAYAATKAEATQLVLDAARAGLDAVIVHPSGILGPYDDGRNHLTQLIQAYLAGRLPGGVTGGYDFVDVRDVALGCLAAARRGRAGECYILSNRYVPIRDLLEYLRTAVRGRRKPCFPLGLAKLAAPAVEALARLRGRRPLFTRYALYTMAANGRFSHDKATMCLGYSPRDIRDTVRDTVRYLQTGTCPL